MGYHERQAWNDRQAQRERERRRLEARIRDELERTPGIVSILLGDRRAIAVAIEGVRWIVERLEVAPTDDLHMDAYVELAPSIRVRVEVPVPLAAMYRAPELARHALIDAIEAVHRDARALARALP